MLLQVASLDPLLPSFAFACSFLELLATRGALYFYHQLRDESSWQLLGQKRLWPR